MSTMGPADELHVAVEAQDVARVQQLLEAAADPATLAAAQDAQGRHALHGLAIVPSTEDDLDDMMDLLGLGGYRQPQDERPSAQQVQIVRLLVGACPALVSKPINGTAELCTPLHWAALRGWHEFVGRLLEAAPAAAMVKAISNGKLSVHLAARSQHTAAAELLLQAAPAAVTATDVLGWTPLEDLLAAQQAQQAHSGQPQLAAGSEPPLPMLASLMNSILAAPAGQGARSSSSSRWPSDPQLVRLLLSVPGQDPSHLLKSLGRPRFDMRQFMAEVVVRYPLTPAQWQLIPSLCPSLAAVLPTVLRRSEAEAALLVARLPDIKRRRLRIGVLCLHHMQAEAGVVLPQPLVWRTLTDSLAH